MQVDDTVDLPHVLALGDDRARAGRRVERRDTGAAGPQALGEGALRIELDRDLTGQHLPLEVGVAADEAADHAGHLPLLQQDRQTLALVAAVIRDDRQAPGATGRDRLDAGLRVAAQAEPPDRDRGPVDQIEQRRLGAGVQLGARRHVHGRAL